MITGGSSGIGEQLTYDFLKRQAKKVIITGRNKQELQRVQSQEKDKIEILIIDFKDSQKVEKTIHEYLNGQEVDILVNNAGMGVREGGLDCSLQFEEEVMSVNFMSHVVVSRLMIKNSLKSNKQLHIVNISSVQGKFGIGQRAVYCASKHAIIGYFDSLRVDLQANYPNQFIITNIMPGYVQTPFADKAHKLINHSNKSQIQNSMTLQQFSSLFFQAIYNQQSEVIIDNQIQARLAIFLRNIVPSIIFKIMVIRQKKLNQNQNK